MRGLSDLGAPKFRLSPDEVNTLRDVILKSAAELNAAAAGSRAIIRNLWNGLPANINLQAAFLGVDSNRIYTGAGDDGLDAMEKNIKDLSQGKASPVPKFSANILQVGTRILATSILPAAPTLHTAALREGVAPLVKNQNYIFRLIAEHGSLLGAFRGAIYNGLLETHFGLLVSVCKDEESPAQKIQIQELSSEQCGYEPELKRIKWAKLRCQYQDLGKHITERVSRGLKIAADKRDGKEVEKIKPSDIVSVWSVWHSGLALDKDYGSHPLSIFVDSPAGSNIYCGTWDDDACRVAIRSFLRPAPGTFVSHAEAHSWLSPIQMCSELLYCLSTEVNTMARIRLHDKWAVPREAIEDGHNNTINGISYIEVDVKPGDPLGVGGKVRPIESDSNLQAILASFNLVWRIVSYIMGISDIDFGDAPSPRKSATEASNIDAHLTQRRKERLEIVADAMKEVGSIVMRVQRKAFGKELVADDGFTYEVPNFKKGAMAVRIDPVEMAHLNLREEASSILTFVQLLGNLRSVFPAGLPAEVRAPLSKVAIIFGEHDMAAALSTPEYNEQPRDRFIRMMTENASEVDVKDTDDPSVFIPYYKSLLGTLNATGRLKYAGVIMQALQKYELAMKMKAAEASVANGIGAAAAPQPQQIPFPQQFQQV